MSKSKRNKALPLRILDSLFYKADSKEGKDTLKSAQTYLREQLFPKAKPVSA